ncbi:MAG: hypothetical protein A4E72_00949 [Syntrophus sp. PtaU1.Bin208]|nr:MAG: hypothetical protein A4E72_00949 [Syntrophus sp. PtaU1.Bin208]
MRQRNPLPQNKQTSIEPPYRHIQEQQIGRLLDQYGIPFFYRSPMMILDQERHKIWQPSFSLPQFGMSVIDYMTDERDISGRIAVYHYNQIPATVLGPRDMDKPNWQQELYERLQKEVLKEPEYSLDRIVQFGRS